MMVVSEVSPQQVRMLGPAAVRSFLRIADAWALTMNEQMQILAVASPETLTQWRGEKGYEALSIDTLERISCVLGIFKAINTLLPDPASADAWMRTANKAPLFGGRSALELIGNGDLARLQALRTYLDAELNR